MSEVGDRLREIRREMGLDQAAFGALGGVNRNTQSKYESGERAPDTDYLVMIRDAGADVAYLLTGEPGGQLGEVISTIAAASRRLTNQQLEAIVSLINAFTAPGVPRDREQDNRSNP